MNHLEIQNLKPLPLWQSWMLFLGLGGCALLLFTFGIPMLTRLGIGSYGAMMIISIVLFGILFVVTLLLYVNEGRPLKWQEIKKRFRIRNITKRYWVLVVIGILIVVISYILLQVTREPIAQWIPELIKTPHLEDNSISFSGNYLALFLFSGLILINVVSEELLWRGYILPRQELQHGKQAWWIHGIQWTCFHWFKPWDLIAILPGALVYGWLATRTKSLIPGLVLHFVFNGLGIIFLAIKVFD